jgi:hypothetical protein
MRCYLDRIPGSVFRERTIDEATELLDTISRNFEDCNIEGMNEEEFFSQEEARYA